MKKIASYLAALVLCTAIASRADQDELGRLTGKSLAAYRQYLALTQERQDLTSGLFYRMQECNRLARQMAATEPQTEADRARIQQNIRAWESQALGLKARIEGAKKALEAGRITDPEERQKLAEQFKEEAKGLRQQAIEAAKPVDDKLAQQQAAHRADDAKLKELLTPFFRSPTDGEFANVKATNIGGYFADGQVSANWLDSNRKRVAMVQLRLRERDGKTRTIEKLDGKYEVYGKPANAIFLWAGSFQVYFRVDQAEWQNPKAKVAILKALVDLDGLARIKPMPPATDKK